MGVAVVVTGSDANQGVVPMSALNMSTFNRNTLIAAVVAVIVGVGGVIAFYTYNDGDDTTTAPTQTQQQTPAK